MQAECGLGWFNVCHRWLPTWLPYEGEAVCCLSSAGRALRRSRLHLRKRVRREEIITAAAQ
jgi:hypothetical protein